LVNKEAKSIISNLLRKSSDNGKGLYAFYDKTTLEKSGHIITNDLGDYLPYLHYCGFIDECRKNIKYVLGKYDVFYQENTCRYGSTKLAKYGVIDLYSNSDYFQGLLFALQHKEYAEFHDKIRSIFKELIKIIFRTRYTHFIKIAKAHFSLPIFRLLDIGMYPELFTSLGYKEEAAKIIEEISRQIIKANKPLVQLSVFNIGLKKDPVLMKDHTNFMFSYIRFFRENPELLKKEQLKNIIKILMANFSENGIIFNSIANKGKRADSLSFAFLEVLLEAYELTKDNYYFEQLSSLLGFWLKTILKHKVLPVYINVADGSISECANVDPNTDFFVLLKKVHLFTGSKLVAENFLTEYKRNILKYFLNKDSYDVHSNYNFKTKRPESLIKSKFSSLFIKVFIADEVDSLAELNRMEMYLDDR
jgi:hypothetical protein